MKILYGSSGTSTHDHNFINYLLEKGHDVVLVSFLNELNPAHQGFLSHERLKIYHFNIKRSLTSPKPKNDFVADNHKKRVLPQFITSIWSILNYLIGTVINTLILAFLVRKIRPDVLNGHVTATYGFYSVLTFYKPFLLTVWGTDVLLLPKYSQIYKAVNKFVLKYADKVIVDSIVQEHAALNLGCAKDKIVRFPWAVNLDRFNPHVDGTNVRKDHNWQQNPIIFICRWHETVYGIEYLIRAIPTILKEFPNTRFLIGGSGHLTPTFQNMIKDLGVTEFVKLVGQIPYEKMPEHLSAIDIYVSTSFSDGASAALLEAMACKKPVVVTDIPANNEWIKNGKNGFIVPIKDENAIADAIISLLGNRELQQKMGERNWKIVQEKADFQKGLAMFENTLKQLIK